MTTSIEPRRRQRGRSQMPGMMEPFDRWLRDFDDFFASTSALEPLLGRSSDTGPGCACDLIESDSSYIMAVDVPGVRREDIDIDVSGNVLTVHGERKEEMKSDDKQRASYTERRYGSFDRAFTLPADVDTTRVEASVEDGVLRVVLPKAAEAKRHKIAIKEGGGLLARAKEAVGLGAKSGVETPTKQ